jgi:hypothetical protein
MICWSSRRCYLLSPLALVARHTFIHATRTRKSRVLIWLRSDLSACVCVCVNVVYTGCALDIIRVHAAHRHAAKCDRLFFR